MFELTTSISKLDPIKQAMYDLLSTDIREIDESSIAASQNLGVSLTNSMKKEGVNIIQMQNVISKKVLASAVEVLKLLDALQKEALELAYVIPDENPVQIEVTEMKQIPGSNEFQSDDPDSHDLDDLEDLVETICKMCLTNKITMNTFLDMMKKAYAKNALEISNNVVKDSGMLVGMSPSAFSIMKNRMGL